MEHNDLEQKAAALLASNHFMTISDDGALAEKQSVFLVLCGKKPVSEATSGKWVQTADGRHSVPDDEQQLGEFLSSLGLVFHLRSDEYATDATVSYKSTLLQQFVNAADASETGRLFGYPESAVAAFDTEAMLSFEEQDKLMEAAGLPLFMPQFRMSKAHARYELEVLLDWFRSLKEYGLA